jgi:hypothetical protein
MTKRRKKECDGGSFLQALAEAEPAIRAAAEIPRETTMRLWRAFGRQGPVAKAIMLLRNRMHVEQREDVRGRRLANLATRIAAMPEETALIEGWMSHFMATLEAQMNRLGQWVKGMPVTDGAIKLGDYSIFQALAGAAFSANHEYLPRVRGAQGGRQAATTKRKKADDRWRNEAIRLAKKITAEPRKPLSKRPTHRQNL